MALFGLSGTGRAAQGFPGTLNKFSFDQMQQFLDRGQKFGDRGNFLTDNVITRLTNRANEGLPGVGAIRGTGKEIMPIQPALQNRQSRLQQILNNFQNNVTPADATAGQISGNIDTQAANVNRAGDQVSSELNESAGRLSNTSSGFTEGMIQNLLNSFGSLTGQAKDAFGGLRAGNQATFDEVGSNIDESFGNAFTDLEATRPSGELRAATATRAFAPQVRRTMQALRRSGIDPNSPEGQAALNNVREGASRARDDALADSTERFADKSINLNLGQGNARTGALLGELGNELNLGTGELGLTTDLGQNLISGVTGLQQGNLGNQLDIESGRSAGQIRNVREGRDLSNDVSNQRSRNALLNRALEQEDFGTISNLLREQNAEELLGLDLGNEQFDRGLNLTAGTRDRENQAISQLLGLGQADLNNLFRSANTAQGFGNQALQSALNSFLMNNQGGGLGKFLLGAGTRGAGLIPGIGPALSTIFGG